VKLFTIGYGGRTPDDFVARLTAAGVKAVVDVRLRPDKASMGSYVKASDPAKGIEGLLARNGIGYLSLVELGNLFMGYEDWPARYGKFLGRAGDLLFDGLAGVPEPFCLMCAEKRAAECHRGQIAECLAAKGWEVEHLE
jgi:uncharacterized protein (DUF488 family)